MTDADFAAAHDEAYGSFADAHREVYGASKASRARARLTAGGRGVAQQAPRADVRRRREPPAAPSYRVTSHARVRCDCGVYVYTESRDGRPPVLPPNCWRCLSPLTQ